MGVLSFHFLDTFCFEMTTPMPSSTLAFAFGSFKSTGGQLVAQVPTYSGGMNGKLIRHWENLNCLSNGLKFWSYS